MRILIAASALVSLFAAGVVVSACGSSSSQPTTPTATATPYAGTTCPPPGYPNPPPGCVPYGTQPTAPATAYPTAPPPTAPPPTAPPTAPAPTVTGMSAAGTIVCTDDGPVCGTAHCNKAVGKCATPCGSTQYDCLPGNYCTVVPLAGPICQPIPNLGQVLP